jgi:hypothetical protein
MNDSSYNCARAVEGGVGMYDCVSIRAETDVPPDLDSGSLP